jgi:hypothetical protein
MHSKKISGKANGVKGKAVYRKGPNLDLKVRHSLSLIAFKGHLYPSTIEDYAYLKQRSVTVYRIPTASLGVIKKTRIPNAEITLVPFSTMWRPFVESMETQLEKFGSVRLVSPREVLVVLPAKYQEAVDKYLAKVGNFCRRYCIQTKIEKKQRIKEKTDAEGNKFTVKEVLVRVTMDYNEEINNSYAFVNNPDDEPYVELTLAQSVKLRLVRSYVGETPTLQVLIMDKNGDKWSEASNRSGIFSKIPKIDISNTANFLMELL